MKTTQEPRDGSPKPVNPVLVALRPVALEAQSKTKIQLKDDFGQFSIVIRRGELPDQSIQLLSCPAWIQQWFHDSGAVLKEESVDVREVDPLPKRFLYSFEVRPTGKEGVPILNPYNDFAFCEALKGLHDSWMEKLDSDVPLDFKPRTIHFSQFLLMLASPAEILSGTCRDVPRWAERILSVGERVFGRLVSQEVWESIRYKVSKPRPGSEHHPITYRGWNACLIEGQKDNGQEGKKPKDQILRARREGGKWRLTIHPFRCKEENGSSSSGRFWALGDRFITPNSEISAETEGWQTLEPILADMESAGISG